MAVALSPRTELVGRELEVAALRERLRDPAVRLVTVTGRAGVGKSRLVGEVVREIGAEFERVEVLDAAAVGQEQRWVEAARGPGAAGGCCWCSTGVITRRGGRRRGRRGARR